MRPRIILAQKVSEDEMKMCNGVTRPRRNKTGAYTYVFSHKVYISKDDVAVYISSGFKIYYE